MVIAYEWKLQRIYLRLTKQQMMITALYSAFRVGSCLGDTTDNDTEHCIHNIN
jgi:hypothetical protein